MAGKKKIRNAVRQKIEERKHVEQKKRQEMNPFELKRNKIKHQVLGRKVAKNELGKPLLNRSRAIQKRTQTLLKEYRNKHKSGKGFQDLREIENIDERVISKYKQNQQEISLVAGQSVNLTHKGKPLDDFINDRLTDDDDDDFDLFTRDGFVESTQFGGQGSNPRSAREILQQIMLEKEEKKLTKEEDKRLVEQLDSQLLDLKPLLRYKISGQETAFGAENRDAFDSLLSELIFEGKNQTTNLSTKPEVGQSSDQGKVANEVTASTFSQDPDVVFKLKLKQIDSCTDIELIIKLLKEALTLVQTVTRKSYQLVKEGLLKLTNCSLKFTPKELVILTLSVYFQELQPVTHLLVLKTLNKLKYANYHDVAVSLYLTNFLLRTINKQHLFPELFVHVHNLVRLCANKPKIKLSLFNRFDYEADCILNVTKFADKTTLQPVPQYTVNSSTLFGQVFTNQPVDNIELAFSLAMQVFQLVTVHVDRCLLQPIAVQMLAPLKMDIAALLTEPLSNNLRSVLNNLSDRLATTEAAVIVNRALPKPFILPMLEPRLPEKDSKKRVTANESKQLRKKVKREFKGAQREIHKDATFLRDTYLKEVAKKDRARKQKVNEILRDLSIQQGLYKKK